MRRIYKKFCLRVLFTAFEILYEYICAKIYIIIKDYKDYKKWKIILYIYCIICSLSFFHCKTHFSTFSKELHKDNDIMSLYWQFNDVYIYSKIYHVSTNFARLSKQLHLLTFKPSVESGTFCCCLDNILRLLFLAKNSNGITFEL